MISEFNKLSELHLSGRRIIEMITEIDELIQSKN
jgi:hypothetical protein